MKTNIIKGGKRALGLLLAVCILAVSLFTANIGVNINASAETISKTVTDTWNGGYTALTDSDLDDEGNYIISTAEQLAWLALQAGDSTAGNSYKVADNIRAFYINEGYDNSSFENLKTSLSSGRAWGSTDQAASSFQGTFDGNGVIIYGLYSAGYKSAGLFPYIKGSATFKNVAISDSYISATYNSGAIVGCDGIGYNRNSDNVSFINCAVTNNYLEQTSVSSNVGWGNIGGLVGFLYAVNESLTVNNCIIVDNHVSNANSANFEFNAFVGGFTRGGVSNGSGGYIWPTTTYSNCIADARVYSCANDTYVDKASAYQNIYTTVGFESFVIASQITDNNIKVVAVDDLKGTNVTNTIPNLDWAGTWFVNTTTYPQLRAFHNIVAVNNGDGTHSERCLDCNLVGAPTSHFYNIKDEVYKKSYCACGAYIDGLFDIWDSEGAIADSYAGGSGTEADPYIIETVEQLFKMVRDEGVIRDEEGNKLNKDGNTIIENNTKDEVVAYYKVADGINAFYINDTRNMTNEQFNAAAAAKTLYNWSADLKHEADRCEAVNGGTACDADHRTDAYTYTFAGHFDGNGVTIYGLYSEKTDGAYWAPGTGFVPGFSFNASISNVVFDKCYVYNNKGYVGVITSSFGAWMAAARYPNSNYCDNIRYTEPANKDDGYTEGTLPTLMSVVVRNAYVSTTFSPEHTEYGFASGYVAGHQSPNGVKMQNCLFDATNSTIVSTATNKCYGAFLAKPSSKAYFDQIMNCVVVNGDDVIDVVTLNKGDYSSYTADSNFVLNTYANGVNNSVHGTHDTADYTTINGMPMLNWTAWDNSDEVIAKYGTPMPKLYDGWEYKNHRYYKDAFKNSEYYTNPEGATPVDAGYEQGIFSDFDELVGSGTEADPYIIDNANLLFEIIASGGTNRGIGQYFKLACDLDLGGIQWVNYPTDADVNDGTNQETGESWHKVYYQYKAFAGAIDGDGHTITGMYTATTDTNAGFIPELAATGVVKNLHFRNSYAYASGGNYGVIAGTAASGSVISGCSIDGSENAKFVGYGTATITNSYITVDDSTTYYLADGNTGTPEVDGVTWYQGGADGSKPKLVNHADAMPCADIDGDGNGYEYTTRDLSALKQKLTRKSAYANVYGDVSRNGKTDIRDMVILQREVANDDIDILDGFWKNVKEGNFSIYYDENDNYDFARKMELYLEEVTGVDVAKTKGTTTSNLTIRIVTDADLGANNYSVSYDLETGVLTISGGSFTAVEQGVLAFINGSNDVTGTVYTGTGSLADVLNSNSEAYKTAVPVGGQTYHYVWGDEFDSGDTVNIDGTDYSTVSYDKWLLRNKTVDTTDDHKTEFAYISAATDAQAPGINAVSDGKLTLKRGINSSTDMYASGISSKNSMLYKRGYAEMLVTLPSDGYAFPAWWLLTSPNVYTNYGVQRSLYGKVYELNDSGIYKFDGTTSIFSADDPTTFQYKLPTQTLEIDIFEIIQRPSYSDYTSELSKSEDYDVSFNIHKWYSHATVKDDNTLTVYDLDWANVETNGGFTNKLLTANGSNGENYTGTNTSGYSTCDKIYVHTANLADGQANGSITYQGGKSNTSATPGAAGDSMNVNMAYYRSDGRVKQLKYGFLWTENDMTFSIYDDSTLVYSTTVNKESMNYKNAESYSAGNYGFDQYAYMLIENHWYTSDNNFWGNWAHATDISDCKMEIEYVRLYQLDGARDIVTPETEAFNKNDRFAD